MSEHAEISRRRRWPRLEAALRRPWLVASCLALACSGIAAVTSLSHWPLPRVHDEFGYLLAADTFAHGRLTNPPHPEWRHFETFHVIFQPTYASKYPPGQGLALAAGQVLTGEPAAGLWLLSGLGAAATYWMLLGWTSPRFAALGALLWIGHPSFQLAWGQTFWGGSLAFIGGALAFGAAVRMQHRAWLRDAVAMGVGAIILAVTRPYEGFIFCAATGVWLLLHWVRHGWPPVRQLVLKLVVPMAALIGLGVAALGVYHQAVTGDPLTFPYALHQEQYGQTPLFVNGTPAPRPTYRHAVFDDFHSKWEKGWFERQSTFRGWLFTKIAVTWLAALYFLSPIMAVGVLMSRPWRWSRLRPAVLVAAMTYAAMLAVTFYNPHYWAPFIPLLVVVAVAGLRRIDVISRRRLTGLRLAPLLVAGQLALFGISVVNRAIVQERGWEGDRAAIVTQLEASPERHLIFVRYGPDHNCHREWVFNAADIDGSKVVWARSMNEANDAKLQQYFADRQAWLLEPEARRLTPLPRAESSGDARESRAPLASRQ